MPRDPGQTDRLIRRLRWDELDGSWLLRFAEFARDEDLAGLRTVGDAVSYIQKLEEENPEAAAAIAASVAEGKNA